MPTIKIIVATHKPYQMPDDPMYLPLHVGKAGKQAIGFLGDDTGTSISEENERFCELTGIYWAWKNLSADYIGLVHYRRHFVKKPFSKRLGKNKFASILTKEELSPLLECNPLILPKPRKYYIETMYSHYAHLPYFFEKDLQTLRQVISSMAPDYLMAFDTVMNRTSGHMFNMFIMRRTEFDAYCTWLFPILFETDKRIDVSGYTPTEARAVAYMAEFMLDIWNEKQQLPYTELPVIFMEKQNWIVKGGRFVARKLFPKTKEQES